MKLKNSFIKLKSTDRLYNLTIPVIALTGGISTGKSTVSRLLHKKGIPLLDADKMVKLVYQKQEVKNFLEAHFPQVISDHSIDFRKLREMFFSDREVKKSIENLIHTFLPDTFKEELKKLGQPDFVVYDIPLLFERNLEEKFDLNILVYTTPEIQVQRLMERDNHTEEEALNIIGHQLSIEEKKKRANLIIENTRDLLFLETQVNQLISQLFE